MGILKSVSYPSEVKGQWTLHDFGVNMSQVMYEWYNFLLCSCQQFRTQEVNLWQFNSLFYSQLFITLQKDKDKKDEREKDKKDDKKDDKDEKKDDKKEEKDEPRAKRRRTEEKDSEKEDGKDKVNYRLFYIFWK